MLLMVEKGTRGRILRAVHRYEKANNKCMKNYDINFILSYLIYLDANNLCGWGMSQKLPVNGFKWVKELLKFNECSSAKGFIKIYEENSNKGYILEVDVEYPKKIFSICIVIYYFQPKERKLKNVLSLFVAYMIRKTLLFT